MSKMDNLRAMREARYEHAAARAAKPKAAPAPAPTPATRASSAPPADLPDPADLPEPEAGRCGHRAISGRTCTREAGHAAKSHRYA
jgi:hypothetical protein